ncbi:hypothetical protein [Kitasatospora indigofera]|uniref:hypothetical protein n=1 Tax=Kitasatospora indigofera TaxID=67307 RepID=UPI0036CC7A75
MKPTAIECTRCEVVADLPEDRDHSHLWDAGWRWIGTEGLFSCPECPPVVVVDEAGFHLRP